MRVISWATFSRSSVDLDRDGMPIHQLADEGPPRRQISFAQRQHAEQPPLVIDNVDVIDRFAVGRLQTQTVQCLLDGELAGSQA